MARPRTEGRSRQTLLVVMLTLLAVMGFLFFAFMLTGGWVIYFALVLLAIAAFAGVHYLLWGRQMMEDTTGEREDAELLAKAELNEWDLPERDR